MPARTQTRPVQKTPEPPKPAEPKYPQFGEKIPGSLAGNLTVAPELRFTPSGRPVVNCQVAVSDRVQNPETGLWENSETEFWRVNVWGQMAEHVAECMTRGMRVVAIGYFQDATFQNTAGEVKTVTEFTANDIGPSLLFSSATVKRVQRSTSSTRN